MKLKIRKFLWRESADGGDLGPGVVIRNVVVGRNHDVAVAVGEGVAVGLVQVAGAGGVASGVIGEVVDIGWTDGNVLKLFLICQGCSCDK